MLYRQVIITGASSGFGRAYAARLAGQCEHMVLVARREALLLELRQELMACHPQLLIDCLACDLSQQQDRQDLIEDLKQRMSGACMLINNAGLGDYGSFAASPEEQNRLMVEVNMAAPTYVTRALLPQMIAQGGAIINIASLAADLFIPDFAVYAASKAYLTSWSEALSIELREYRIPVLAVCPGPVHTGFGLVARREGFTGNMTPGKDLFDTSVDTVIEGSLNALARGKTRYYPSLKIAFLAGLIRNMPLALMRLILRRRPRRVQEQIEHNPS